MLLALVCSRQPCTRPPSRLERYDSSRIFGSLLDTEAVIKLSNHFCSTACNVITALQQDSETRQRAVVQTLDEVSPRTFEGQKAPIIELDGWLMLGS